MLPVSGANAEETLSVAGYLDRRGGSGLVGLPKQWNLDLLL